MPASRIAAASLTLLLAFAAAGAQERIIIATGTG